MKMRRLLIHVGFLCSTAALPGVSLAQEIVGVDQIKSDISSAPDSNALRGRTWTIEYRGAQPSVSIIIDPKEAFTTTRTGPRTFSVALTNPNGLYTSQGNPRQIREVVQSQHVDRLVGSGQMECAVTFSPPGRPTPIQLQGREGLQLLWDQSQATFVRYDGARAIFASPVATRINVTLRVADPEAGAGGAEYSAPLGPCGGGGNTPTPPAAPSSNPPLQSPAAPAPTYPTVYRPASSPNYPPVYRPASSPQPALAPSDAPPPGEVVEEEAATSDQEPPLPQAEVQPPAPAPNMTWVPGHWERPGGRWAWIRGSHQFVPVGYVWHPWEWRRERGRYVLIRGHIHNRLYPGHTNRSGYRRR